MLKALFVTALIGASLGGGPLSPDSLVGFGLSSTGKGSSGPPICTVLAQDAWNFDLEQCIGPDCLYGNSSQFGGDMVCGGGGGRPECPEHLATGGLGGTGAIRVESGEPYPSVGLIAIDAARHDFSAANELSISFHITALRATTNTAIGWLVSGVIYKTGEFFTGVDNAGNHGNRVCWNIRDVVDVGGASAGGNSCGSLTPGGNTGSGATTGAGSMVQGDRHHVAFVWDSNVAADDGVYRIYLDGEEVYFEDGITGTIPNTAADLKIGFAPTSFNFNSFDMDNLQIDSNAWNLARVLQADCMIPDSL